jgi:cytoskeletal protein RodZ
MPDVSDEPTVPIGPVPAGFDDEPRPSALPAPPHQVAVGGAHRRDPGDADDERHWPWLASIGALALLGVSGLIWLLVGIPDPASPRQSPSTAAASPYQLSTPEQTVGTPEPATGSDLPTPSGTGSATPSGTPSSSPTITPSGTPTPSPTASPTRSPTPTVVQVPGVVGKPRAAAEAMLRGAGLDVAVVLRSTDSRRQVNRVIAQSPAGGQTVRGGSTITITVGVASTGTG